MGYRTITIIPRRIRSKESDITLTLKISVKSNIKEFTKGLNKFQQSQVPFVVQQTFKQSAFELRKYFIEKTFPQSFKSGRAGSFARAVLRVDMTNAKKDNYIRGDMVVSVHDSTNKDYLLMQQEGGNKVAKSGKYIAVPLPEQKRKLGFRRKASERPNAVTKRKDVFVMKVGGGKSQEAIVQRKKGLSQRLYSLVTNVRIKPTLKFYQHGAKLSPFFIRRFFPSNFRKAVRSSKYNYS